VSVARPRTALGGRRPRAGSVLRWELGLLGLAALLGLLAVPKPQLAIEAAVGLAFLGLVLWDLSVGLYLFTFAAFLEVLPGLGGGVSFAKVAGLALVVSWLATLSVRRDLRANDFFRIHPLITGTMVLFLSWVTMSALWAEVVSAVQADLLRYAPNLLLFPIAFTALRTRRAAIVFAGVFVTAALISSAYGFVFPPPPVVGVEADRLGGAGVDPNFLALALVGAAALSAGLASMRSLDRGVRALWAVGVVICGYGVLHSGSRGGLIALVVAGLVGVVISGPGRRVLMITLAACAIGVGFFYVTELAPADLRARITHSDGGSGRTDLWTIGMRIAHAKPLTGVGAGNFTTSSIHYLLEPGTITRSDFIVDTPKVAHNTYLQVLTELGIPGLILLLTLILFSLRCGVRAWRAFERAGDADMGILCRALVAGLAGMLTAAFFVSAHVNKPLWLLLAIPPALLAIAESRSAPAHDEDHG